MKVPVIGSRGLTVDNLGEYLPKGTTEIVNGGSKGIDTCARNYALQHNIRLTEFLPEYSRYGRGAPLNEISRLLSILTWCWRSGTGNQEERSLLLTNAESLVEK